ncbi:hypothetical protein GDO78_019786 [Eleutherodactylus coqui]|uniref:Uncharacterized protein n=1 Tax=Eleutherodactylus coqui TaxID=57060 RepID=A0A8J6BJ34_ELECQ|nr:hypothetical protein GDO78_019786 [Eleutherodactylus coqui]
MSAVFFLRVTRVCLRRLLKYVTRSTSRAYLDKQVLDYVLKDNTPRLGTDCSGKNEKQPGDRCRTDWVGRTQGCDVQLPHTSGTAYLSLRLGQKKVL